MVIFNKTRDKDTTIYLLLWEKVVLDSLKLLSPTSGFPAAWGSVERETSGKRSHPSALGVCKEREPLVTVLISVRRDVSSEAFAKVEEFASFDTDPDIFDDDDGAVRGGWLLDAVGAALFADQAALLYDLGSDI